MNVVEIHNAFGKSLCTYATLSAVYRDRSALTLRYLQCIVIALHLTLRYLQCIMIALHLRYAICSVS
jgi:hypothetical protein